MTTDPLIGKKLGDYIIVDVLGLGGMARVYRGFDEKLNRYAAVKVFDAHLIAEGDQDEYRMRFQNEARSIARLNHPNIVGVYQFDRIGTIYYMAMGFIEGRDLRAHIKNYAKHNTYMPYVDILRVIRDISGALDYAHKEGVIHRDVKPSNIMVTPTGRAVLTDFGLALDVSEGTIGVTFGSAHYIAPEQAVSSAQAVPQSDLYSLGIVLYEMLANQVPFNDPSAMTVALKHLNEPPPPPSRVNPNLSPQIDQVVLKALNKTPNKRYESGMDFAQALQAAFALSDTESDSPQLVRELPSWDTSPSQSSTRSRTRDTGSIGEVDTVKFSDPSLRPPSMLDDLPTITDSKISNASRAGILRYQKARRTQLIASLVIILVVAIVAIVLLSASSQQARVNQIATATAQAAVAGTGTQAAVVAMAASQTATETRIPTEVPSQTPIPTDTPPSDTPEPTLKPTIVSEPTEAVPTAGATLQVPSVSTEQSSTVTNVPTEAVVAITLTPTDTPSPTQTPSITPSFTATAILPTPTIDDPETKQVILRYDQDRMVLLNRSSEDVDVSGLLFVQIQSDGTELDFESSRWNSGTRPTTALPPGSCFEVLTNTGNLLDPSELCDARYAWSRVSFIHWFWISDDSTAVFEVRRGNTVLAVCPISTGECTIDVHRNT